MRGQERSGAEHGSRRGRARDRAPAPSTLSFPEQVEKARNAALRLLSVRERSAAELRARLRRAGYSPEPIDEVVARLQAAGLQDDQRFAESYAEGAGGVRGYSARRIQTELRSKGVGAELAAAAAAVRPEDELERARDLAFRKLRAMAGVPPEVAARRLMGVLTRRGYSPGVCRDVLSDLVGTEASAPFLDPDSVPDVR